MWSPHICGHHIPKTCSPKPREAEQATMVRLKKWPKYHELSLANILKSEALDCKNLYLSRDGPGTEGWCGLIPSDCGLVHILGCFQVSQGNRLCSGWGVEGWGVEGVWYAAAHHTSGTDQRNTAFMVSSLAHIFWHLVIFYQGQKKNPEHFGRIWSKTRSGQALRGPAVTCPVSVFVLPPREKQKCVVSWWGGGVTWNPKHHLHLLEQKSNV